MAQAATIETELTSDGRASNATTVFSDVTNQGTHVENFAEQSSRVHAVRPPPYQQIESSSYRRSTDEALSTDHCFMR